MLRRNEWICPKALHANPGHLSYRITKNGFCSGLLPNPIDNRLRPPALSSSMTRFMALLLRQSKERHLWVSVSIVARSIRRTSGAEEVFLVLVGRLSHC